MSDFQVDSRAVSDFDQDGFFLARNIFRADEMQLLRDVAENDRALEAVANTRRDAEGGETKLALRNDLGDDMLSAVVRSHRLVDTMELLLGEEVYHYHHKMSIKEPRVGGAWEWHQDYGYWYNFGCLFPRMASVMVAIDRATRANGCLQVIKGSHHLGRIEHGLSGEQVGADMERVEAALERLEHLYVELEPGDALFFHANLLHRSDQNRSDDPRWALVCCYNAASNSPYKKSCHSDYQLLEKCPDSRVAEVGQRQLAELRAAVR